MEADFEKSFAENICLPFLRNSQNQDGGWGFHPGCESRVEPTCWALQALSNRPAGETRDPSLERGFHYLRAAQLPDGSWPATPADDAGCWLTSVCCSVLAHAPGCSAGVLAGLQWVCGDWPADTTPWRRFLAKLASRRDVAPVDYSLRGWSWTPGTSSWVEPTALALIALEHGSAPLPAGAAKRRELAEALLYDRMCPGGGWNCGNPLVYGVPGEPLVGPTVWALIALRHHPARPENVVSLEWLANNMASIRSAGSLALARLGLSIYGRTCPNTAPTFRSLYARNEFLKSVQVAAWTCLALSDHANWLSPVGMRTT